MGYSSKSPMQYINVIKFDILDITKYLQRYNTFAQLVHVLSQYKRIRILIHVLTALKGHFQNQEKSSILILQLEILVTSCRPNK